MSFTRFACCLVIALYAGAGGAFSFEDVAVLAQIQARQPYRDSSRKAPAQLQALNYDQYRDIRFRPDRALWRDDKLPFEVMFFHLGKFQNERRAHRRGHAGKARSTFRIAQRRFRLRQEQAVAAELGRPRLRAASARTTR